MGIFQSKLSEDQQEILRYCVGMKAEELKPLFENIPVHVYTELKDYQKHAIPNTIAFRVLRGEYVVNTKSVFGGKTTRYC